MHNPSKIAQDIRQIADGRFTPASIEEFIAKFCSLSCGIIDYVLQISTDEGDELEIGFFTATNIVDITLSDGKTYSCTYPVTAITNVAITETGTKSTLVITGEKKFDYNVVKPNAIDGIENYKKSLQHHLIVAAAAPQA